MADSQTRAGQPEWHEHRRRHRNASETPAVLGVSPWQTPYQLFLTKTGRSITAVNAAMARGARLEPLARQAYEQLTGVVVEPLVLVDGDYSASLDGITLTGELVVEIKCPFQGRDSTLWLEIESGQLPEHYFWQVQHQLMVSKALLAHVYVWDGRQGIVLEQRPEPGRWARIRAGWDQFMEFVRTDQPPPVTRGDAVLREDAEWQRAAHVFIELKRAADEAALRADAAKQRLIALTRHSSEQGAGVSVSRYWKSGTVDYKRVPQLTGVDLEQYRAAPREETRVTIVK